MILRTGIPALALLLILLGANAKTSGSRYGRVARVILLVALAGACAGYLALHARNGHPMDRLSIAAACFMLGWLVLDCARRESDVFGALAQACESLAVGMAAATLLLLSLVFAGHSQLSIWMLSVLGGVFTVCVLSRVTTLHLALSAAAWLSLGGGSIDQTGVALPAVGLFLFFGSGSLGSLLLKGRPSVRSVRPTHRQRSKRPVRTSGATSVD